ncbi:hypothetical protein V8E36_009957 [Tilletia maclaganii]
MSPLLTLSDRCGRSQTRDQHVIAITMSPLLALSDAVDAPRPAIVFSLHTMQSNTDQDSSA